MNVSVAFLVKDPPIDRLAALVEFLRCISDDFIFVVDDRTEQGAFDAIASWPDTTIVPFEWCDDFSAARNAGLSKAKRGWTLVLDYDEIPSLRMVEHIKEVTSNSSPLGPAAYIYWTVNYWGGVRGQAANYHWHIRLFRTGQGKFYRRVHELVALNGADEAMTRGGLAAYAPQDAYLIHSKGDDRLEEDQALYERLGERSL